MLSPIMSVITSLLTARLYLQPVSASSDDTSTATVKTIFDSNDGMDINGIVLAVGALLVGTMLIVVGYRFWRTTVYALGLLGGGVTTAVIFENVFKHETWVLPTSWIAFVIGGIIVGYICLYLHWIGIFMSGAVAGAVIGILLNTSVGYRFAPSHPNTVLIILVAAFALVSGAMALWLQKPALIAATSLVGAFLLSWGIGYFVGNYPALNDLERYRTSGSGGDIEYSIPGAWWGYLIGTLVVFAFSMVLQFRFTGKDVKYHTLDSQCSDDVQPHHGNMTPARVQYTNMGTPDVQTQQSQYQQQRYPTSRQVRWEDLQNQPPRSQTTARPQNHQLSDRATTSTRPAATTAPNTLYIV